MSKLQAALRWAARGFRVFRLEENGKLPETALGWTTGATTDEATIRDWWMIPVLGHEANWNIGVLTTGWVVVDVDTKPGKVGWETFNALGIDMFNTLVVQTASGGYHVYFRGDAGCVPFGRDVDCKSRNGYVVAPGSTIDGKTYEVVLDLPVAEFPEHLRHLLKAPRARRDSSPHVEMELDSPEAIEIAAHWLTREAPVAIEGQNGDDTTYRVACRLRDFGLSEDAAVDLMLDEYNPRCEPPWPGDDLRAKVENAYRYASGAQGAANPVAVFGSVDFVPQPSSEVGHAQAEILLSRPREGAGGVYRFGTMIDEANIPPRPWVIQNILLAGASTLVFAVGGAGKSTLSLIIAAHLAMGLDVLDSKTVRPGKSIIYNAEDDEKELARKMAAICRIYNFPIERIKAMVSLNSKKTVRLRVTEGAGPTLKINLQMVEDLVADALDPEVRMIALDPLISLHTTNENSNAEMDYVMGVLAEVAERTETAMLVVHHTGKPPVANSNAWVGDQMSGRGATALPYAARKVLTLFRPTEDDDVAPKDQLHRYVRLDGAKGNYSESTGTPLWYRWHSCVLSNNDSVGVLVPHDARTAANDSAAGLARVLRDRMMRVGRASLTIAESVAAVQDADPAAAKQDARAVRSRIERALAAPVTVDGATLRIERAAEGGRTVFTIVMA